MAITKLNYMKTSGHGSPGRHLKNAIAYILNPDKTENDTLIGGNAGSAAEEIYQTFLETKEEYGKNGGRQGYHFIISFKEGECSEEKLYELAEQWCERYLKNHYDYVFAVHNDKKHLHAHVIFNSVARSDGYKYHYQKGDWEKYIQPVTDQLCKEMELPVLEYIEWGKRKNKNYGEYAAKKDHRPTGRDILKADIDSAVQRVTDYKDFLRVMQGMGYVIKEGYSEKRMQEYVSFKGEGRAYRTLNLGQGYSVQDLKRRILSRENEYKKSEHIRRKQLPKMIGWNTSLGNRNYQKRYYVTRFQLIYVRRTYRAGHIESRYARRSAVYRKDIRRVEMLAENCRYLIANNIQSSDQARAQLAVLQRQQKNSNKSGEAISEECQKGIRILRRICWEMDTEKVITETKTARKKKQKEQMIGRSHGQRGDQ